MTAEVTEQYDPPQDRPTGSMANMQELKDGIVVVGWGQEPCFPESTDDDELIVAASHSGDGS